MSWGRLSFHCGLARFQTFLFSTFPARMGTLLLAGSHIRKVDSKWKFRQNVPAAPIITGTCACCAATACSMRLPGSPRTPATTVSPVAEKPIAPKTSVNRQRSNKYPAGRGQQAAMSGIAEQHQSRRKSFSDRPTLRRTFLKVMVARSPFCSVMTSFRTVPSP